MATSPTKKIMKTPAKPAAAAVADAETKPAAKTVVKSATKPVAKPAPKAETVETPEAATATDLIVSTAKEVENLKSEKAFALVPRLLDNIDHDYFRLGGVLSKVHSEGWYQEKGYETFKAYVEAEVGMQYRKGMYLIGIYNALVESGIEWSKVGHLGWTKLKDLAPILSPENVDEWVAVAETMTALQLQEHIKAAMAGQDSGSAGDAPDAEAAKQTTTMNFKVHKDQKATVREALDKAKNIANTEVDAVALEYIAMDYLSGGTKGKSKPMSLVEVLKTKSVEEVLDAVGIVFPTLVLQATMYDTVEEAQEAQAALDAEGGEEGGEEVAAEGAEG